MAAKNHIVSNAANMTEGNEWTMEEYLQYVADMDAQDFRKYYGTSDFDEAKRILLPEG